MEMTLVRVMVKMTLVIVILTDCGGNGDGMGVMLMILIVTSDCDADEGDGDYYTDGNNADGMRMTLRQCLFLLLSHPADVLMLADGLLWTDRMTMR